MQITITLALILPFAISAATIISRNLKSSNGRSSEYRRHSLSALRAGYLDEALAVEPDNINALNGKGNILSEQGNYTGAIQYYESFSLS
jgi:hypothetical protein